MLHSDVLAGWKSLIDSALRHLLCLVDSETLFNAALSTYNFDLVLTVAERSQKVN